jgi:hypothetical protein
MCEAALGPCVRMTRKMQAWEMETFNWITKKTRGKRHTKNGQINWINVLNVQDQKNEIRKNIHTHRRPFPFFFENFFSQLKVIWLILPSADDAGCVFFEKLFFLCFLNWTLRLCLVMKLKSGRKGGIDGKLIKVS